MQNHKEDLFDKIEAVIDIQNDSNSTQQAKSSFSKGETQFEEEMAFRLQLQRNWNKAARYGKLKNNIKQISMNNKPSNRKLRFLSVAVAASLLFMLSIPAYNYFTNKGGKELQIDQSAIKSSLTFYDSRYKQISPVNGQFIGESSILFEWETSLAVKTTLVISNTETGDPVLFQSLNSEVKNFRLTEKLDKGRYTWRLDGFKGEMIFIIK